jgi:hypothetical protein
MGHALGGLIIIERTGNMPIKCTKHPSEKHWFLIRRKPGNPASPLPEEGKKSKVAGEKTRCSFS